jgi:hypothetical protein
MAIVLKLQYEMSYELHPCACFDNVCISRGCMILDQILDILDFVEICCNYHVIAMENHRN